MVAAAFDSVRWHWQWTMTQEDERAAQGQATQQPASERRTRDDGATTS
jgi:hypothetical protein